MLDLLVIVYDLAGIYLYYLLYISLSIPLSLIWTLGS